jgi:protein TonB
MTEGVLYQPKRTNPTALTIVVLMHGAAIAALALSKMEVIENPFKPTVVIDIKNPPPPPPEPQPVRQVKQQQPKAPPIYVPPRLIDPPLERLAVTTTVEPQPYYPPIDRGPVILLDPSPPPSPPPPKKVEPARAKANLASYISDADYPASAARNEEAGTTRFRLAVGANGRVEQCEVTASSGSSALDSATCRIMKNRAKFTPARDSDGRATGDSVTSAIKWVLPRD